MHLNKGDRDRTVSIDASGVETTERDLSEAKVNMLVQNGQQGATTHLQWFKIVQMRPLRR
jgi:hypothetical protein